MDFRMATGPIVWLIAASGAAAALMFVTRWFALRRARVDHGDFISGVANVLEKGNDDEALVICDETPGPVAEIVSTAIRHRGGGVAELRSAVNGAGRIAVSRLARKLAPLAIIAQTAPLMGLLGTVVGLVSAATALNSESFVSRTAFLSASMSSLWAAGAGLAVAMAAQLMHEILRVRLDRIVTELEAAASEIVATIAARGRRP